MLILPFAITLLLTPPGTPAGGFRWQRIITPPTGSSNMQACVVLDAATFANGAPALRDLRLFQDGTELPYVVEESYDERALNSGVTPEDDRSEYEPVYVAHLRPEGAHQTSSVGNSATVPDQFTYSQTFLIDAHVPVERIRLASGSGEPSQLSLSATPVTMHGNVPNESATHRFDASHPAWPFTLGANLQTQARMLVTDRTSSRQAQDVVFEMRRRSLCYQPRSSSPLMLYLGGGQGLAAKVYGLANGFSTALERPYATMGPLEPNPDEQHGQKRSVRRLLFPAAITLATLLLTLGLARPFLENGKGRPKAAQS